MYAGVRHEGPAIVRCWSTLGFRARKNGPRLLKQRHVVPVPLGYGSTRNQSS